MDKSVQLYMKRIAHQHNWSRALHRLRLSHQLLECSGESSAVNVGAALEEALASIRLLTELHNESLRQQRRQQNK